MKIFHIVNKSVWAAAKKAGKYEPESLLDQSDKGGFIHCSHAQQILEVANKFYVGHKDLIILRINVEKVQAEIKDEVPFEAPWSTVLYPHIYGPLNIDAVEAEIPFPAKSDGTFELPKLF
jgi:uncharacterized protein (DUF952 family)